MTTAESTLTRQGLLAGHAYERVTVNRATVTGFSAHARARHDTPTAYAWRLDAARLAGALSRRVACYLRFAAILCAHGARAGARADHTGAAMDGVRAPDWTIEEFDILLSGAEWTDEGLVEWLPRRTDGAIGAVRAFVHAAHSDGSRTGLSRMMQDRLAARKGTLTCAVCNARF
jgi:hypothetical protein